MLWNGNAACGERDGAHEQGNLAGWSPYLMKIRCFPLYVIRDAPQHAVHPAPVTEGGVPVQEELDRVGHEVALGHGEEVSERAKTLVADGRVELALRVRINRSGLNIRTGRYV